MSTKWITNTMYLHGFSSTREIFSFFNIIRDHAGRDSEIELNPDELIDLDYLTVNVSNMRGAIKVSVSFLTTEDVARKHVSLVLAESDSKLHVLYAVINTRTDAVELYSFQGKELHNHKSIPKGLGKPLLEELEKLPEPGFNVSMDVGELSLLDYEDFFARIRRILPPGFE